MDRLAQVFACTRSGNRAAFVAYLCAGDPDFDTSLALCQAALGAGVDILELGVPFSDPVADGPTNQQAAQRALESGMTVARVLELVRAIRRGSEVPVVFYTYYNLVYAHGLEASIRAAREAGVDALLTLDLPPEEAGEYLDLCRRHGLRTVFIVAPTTPASRLPTICGAATGFIYYVSREGVTGTRQDLAGDIPAAVARIRAQTALPVVVGFGISTRAQVRQVAQAADGVVVGSALVNVIAAGLSDRAGIPARLAAVAADLTAGVRRA